MTVKNMWPLIVAAMIMGLIAYFMVWQPFRVSGWNNNNEDEEEEYSTPYSTPYNYPTPDEYTTPYTTPEEYPTPYSTPYTTPVYATPVSVEQALTPAGPPLCVAQPVQHAPTITEVKRLTPDSVFVAWSTTDVSKFHVYYGFVGQALVWNTIVEGQSTTLDNLPEDSPLDVKVCSISVCGEELCGVIVDP